MFEARKNLAVISNYSKDVYNLVFFHHGVGGQHRGGGVQMSCSKIGFFEVLRAQRAFGARQVFGTTFSLIQNFYI